MSNVSFFERLVPTWQHCKVIFKLESLDGGLTIFFSNQICTIIVCQLREH